jgi:hypothetical protein
MAKALRKAQLRLARRIHGGNGEHRERNCGCAIWEKKGYRKPGSLKK